ncbi:hypothetical protein [Pseudomonas sp. LFM046]|uniref:hypothetical protein n=1 Tax=Pseudomonas sp. LFM046 TaxID=1608357 RepID=UPI0005CFED8F|nr:hypothetical protein [Pseudomonas sp. LFM046]
MAVRMYKVLEEHLFEVEGLDFMVKGRISHSDQLPPEVGGYYWEISHFYKPTEGATGPYYPSVRNGKILEAARQGLFFYAKSFRNIGVVAAKY